MLNRLDECRRLRYHDKSALAIAVKAVLLLAVLETVALGLPLASANTDWANFSPAIDDAPALTITARSVGIESGGILLVFPLACLAAGFMAAKYQRTKISGAS